MASARLERTTIDLRDGTGRTGLRATGQVVIFPGFLTLYEEGVVDSEDENAKLLPRLREGDAPEKISVSADQHFTQPPPSYSAASMVKKPEQLGIGRPSTYASTLHKLTHRHICWIEKNRFIDNDNGRRATAII